MLEILTSEYEKIHKHGGNTGIGPGCRLILALTYWREYRAMRQMAFDYDLSVSSVCDGIKWVETILSKHHKFVLGGIEIEIEKLEQEHAKVECIIGDVEEQRIERPTNNQEEYYSGKKKYHSLKNQFIVDSKTLKIINYCKAKGTVHDYKIIKESGICPILKKLNIKGKFDSGYQGIQDLMEAEIPFKKSKKHELTEEEKAYNHELSKKRVKIEHVNRTIKIFRIAKETYRNHMNRYEEKMQIIIGIYNLNLDC